MCKQVILLKDVLVLLDSVEQGHLELPSLREKIMGLPSPGSRQKPKMKGKLERLEKLYSLDEVFPHIYYSGPQSRYHVFGGHGICMDSLRYICFARQRACVSCGLEGAYFAMERHLRRDGSLHEVRYHFNMYGLKGGKEILFTKDHILPRSLGGADHLSNLQTMCLPCNQKKGATVSPETELLIPESVCLREKI